MVRAVRAACVVALLATDSLIVLFLSAVPVNAEPFDGVASLGIRRITPAGEDVPPANQVLIEFDRPVVPLGRMERKASELPITITPRLNCKWRWINRRALSCNLDERDRMAEATKYSITVNPGITATDGAAMALSATREFITRRPDISHIGFKTWRHPAVVK